MKNDTTIHAKPLWDLIPILTERLDIYRATISALDADRDVGLIAFLDNAMQLTQQFISQLNGVLAKEDHAFSEADWVAGDLYALWKERRPLLSDAESGEPVMQVIAKTEEALCAVFEYMLSHTDKWREDTIAMLTSQAELQQDIAEEIEQAKKKAMTNDGER